MEKPILIAATSHDEHAYAPVRNQLEKQGFPVVVYRTDKVLSGEERLHIELSNKGALTMSYDDMSIVPADIGAAWYRKVAAFQAGNETDDQAKQLHIGSEIRALHETIWGTYPESIWLNAPERMHLANGKLGQLLLAHELDFVIPHTAVSNHWDDVRKALLVEYEQIIVKTIRGIISDHDVLKAMYTTVLDDTKLRALKDQVTPFPGIYQPYISKLREWRVTVVGEKVFPAAIYTDSDAKDDWRKHQLNPTVRFTHEQLPDQVEEKCLRFLGRLGLKFGAFDFIESNEGELVFLECNPNGQYGWLEKELGFPISESIASELITIARRV